MKDWTIHKFPRVLVVAMLGLLAYQRKVKTMVQESKTRRRESKKRSLSVDGSFKDLGGVSRFPQLSTQQPQMIVTAGQLDKQHKHKVSCMLSLGWILIAIGLIFIMVASSRIPVLQIIFHDKL